MPCSSDDFRSIGRLKDGTTIQIRRAGPEDIRGLEAFHEGLSDETVYFRFFSRNRRLARERIARFLGAELQRHVTTLALRSGEVIGMASYDRAKRGVTAQISCLVSDPYQDHGVGTLLIEHLAQIARGQGIYSFTAMTLTANRRAVRSLCKAHGVCQRGDQGIVEFQLPIADLLSHARAPRPNDSDHCPTRVVAC